MTLHLSWSFGPRNPRDAHGHTKQNREGTRHIDYVPQYSTQEPLMYHRNSRGSLDLNYGISMELIPRPHILLLHPSSHHPPTVNRPPPSKKDGSTSSPQHTPAALTDCPSLDKKHSLPYNFLPSIRTVCHQLPQGNTLVLCFSTRIHAEVHDARE